MNHFFQSDLSLSPKENQDAYILFAYCKIFKTNEPIQYHPWWNNQLINANRSISNDEKALFLQLYFEGRSVFQVLNCSIEDFYKAIFFQGSIYPGHLEYKARKKQPHWYNRHGSDFRKPMKYVKNKDHKPKFKTEAELDHSSWRKEKGFEKDYRRQNSSKYGERKTFFKKISNRCFRRNEKKLIKKEKYDQLIDGRDRTYFDPWDWD